MTEKISCGTLVWNRKDNPFHKYEILEMVSRNGTVETHLISRAGSQTNNKGEIHQDKNNHAKLVLKFVRRGSTLAGSESVQSLKEIGNEVKILQQMDHPSIIKIYETYQFAKSIYIVTDFASGGPVITEATSRCASEDAANILGQVLSAVRYLHDRDVVHGNLCPDTIHFENETREKIKLIDLTSARKSNAVSSSSRAELSAIFAAPERVVGNSIATTFSDMWSVGAIAYAMVTGWHPPLSTDGEGAGDFSTTLFSVGDMTNDAFLGSDAVEFLQQLLQRDPSSRLDSHQAQRHPWIKQAYKTGDKAAVDRSLLNLIIQHLTQTASEPKLKKAALAVIAHDGSSRALGNELQQLEIIFSHCFDKNKSGVISIRQFERTLSKHGLVDQNHVQLIFDSMDINGDTTVHLSEFLGATVECVKEINDFDVMLAFQRMSSGGGSGEADDSMENNTNFGVSAENIMKLFDISSGNAQAIIDQVTTSSMGRHVDYDSFVNMFRPRKNNREKTTRCKGPRWFSMRQLRKENKGNETSKWSDSLQDNLLYGLATWGSRRRKQDLRDVWKHEQKQYSWPNTHSPAPPQRRRFSDMMTNQGEA